MPDVTAEVLKREALRRNESRAHMMIQGGNIGTCGMGPAHQPGRDQLGVHDVAGLCAG